MLPFRFSLPPTEAVTYLRSAIAETAPLAQSLIALRSENCLSALRLDVDRHSVRARIAMACSQLTKSSGFIRLALHPARVPMLTACAMES